MLNVIPKMIDLLADPSRRRVTKFVSPKLTIKVTRRFRLTGRARAHDFVVTQGVPNHRERGFIRDCQKSGVPFPVRKLQIQHWPKKKVA